MTITRVYQTGFELNSLSLEMSITSGNYVTIQAVPKTGSYSVRIGAVTPWDDGYTYYALPTDLTQLRTGYHLRYTPGNYANILASIRDASNNIIYSIRGNGSNTGLGLFNSAGAQVGSYYNSIADQYYHIGLDIKKSATDGWCYFYVDGNLAASFDGNNGATAIHSIWFGKTGGVIAGYNYYDDFYIDNTSGESSPTTVPDLRFNFIKANGNGYSSQWNGSDGNQVDNYQQVDDAVPPDSDTTYNSVSLDGMIDAYVLGDYSPTVDSQVAAVIPIAVVKKMDASAIGVKLGTRVSEINEIGTMKELASSYQAVWDRFTTKPGGGSWTESDIDNAEIVVESDGSF